MTADAIEKTTQALKNRIEQAINPRKVHIGAPIKGIPGTV